MKVWIVVEYDYTTTSIDSVWADPDKAVERAEEMEKAYTTPSKNRGTDVLEEEVKG